MARGWTRPPGRMGCLSLRRVVRGRCNVCTVRIHLVTKVQNHPLSNRHTRIFRDRRATTFFNARSRPHWLVGPHHLCRHPSTGNAVIMHLTATLTKTGLERQYRHARRSEKHPRRARILRRSNPIPNPVQAAGATARTDRGGKCLSSAQIQTILTSTGTLLGECRLGSG